MRHLILWLLFVTAIFMYSCQPEAGEGGTAVISGKVYAKDVRNGFLIRVLSSVIKVYFFFFFLKSGKSTDSIMYKI